MAEYSASQALHMWQTVVQRGNGGQGGPEKELST